MINRFSSGFVATVCLLGVIAGADVPVPSDFANEAHEKLYSDYRIAVDRAAEKLAEHTGGIGARFEEALDDRLVSLAVFLAPDRIRELKKTCDGWLAAGGDKEVAGEVPVELKFVVAQHKRAVRRVFQANELSVRTEIDRLIRGLDAQAATLGVEPEGKEKATALRAEAAALMAHRGGRQSYGKLEVANFDWRKGDPAFLRMQTVGDELLGLTFLTGTFAGGGEFQEITRLGKGGPLGLAAQSAQGDVRSAAIALRDPRLKMADAVVSLIGIDHTQRRKKLIHQSKGFCYLGGIWGHWGELAHGEVSLDPEDGFYYLSGRWPVDAKAWAVVVEYPEGEMPNFERSISEWKRGDPVRDPIDAKDGICLMTGVSGALLGGGELVFVRIGSDARWHVGGRSGVNNTGVKAVVLKFKE